MEDIITRTIVPPLTNGGMIRSMDNRQLAAWLAQQHENTAKRGAWTEEQYFRWLNNPTVDGRGDAESVPSNDGATRDSALHSFPTCELVAELRTREGVEITVVEPYVETLHSCQRPRHCSERNGLREES